MIRRAGFAGAARARAADAKAAAAQVMRDRGLRNLETSLLANWTAEHAYLVALGIYAYEVGGALALGLVGLGRLLPAGVLALIASVAADRYPREAVLRVVYFLRAGVAAASAIAFFAGAPALVVLLLGGLVTVVSAALRPAYWALLPGIATTPEQLTASNVIASTSEGVALLVGPAAGGLLMGATSTGFVFAAGAALFLVSGVLALGVAADGRRVVASERRRVLTETIEGLRAVGRHRDTRRLVLVGGAQTFVRGALSVLIVITALHLLEIGEPGVGFLNSAFGVGNLVGAVAALTLVGRRRLGGVLIAGLWLWGAPIAMMGIWPNTAVALMLLVLPGWGNAIFDVAILTMLQRITPDDVLGRVFGLLETAVFASMAAGSIAASGLVALIGIRPALIVTGFLLPAVALATWPWMRAIDDRSEVPEEQIGLLRGSPLFASLPAVALEHLAGKLEPAPAAAKSVVFRKGDEGDRFFIIGSGTVTVKDGRRALATLGAGDFFGEIALLRQAPRMATVTVKEDALLYSLRADDFLSAVSRYEQCARVADHEAEARIEDARRAAERKRHASS